MRAVVLDIETSGGPDLRQAGAAKYFASGEVKLEIAVSSDLDSDEYRNILAPAAPGSTMRHWPPLTGALIYAHNADFDRRGLETLAPDIVDGAQWACTMGLARALNIPGALGNACRFLFGDDYAKTELPTGDDLLTGEAMRDYCINDVRITKRLLAELKAIHRLAYKALGHDDQHAKHYWLELHREMDLNSRINRRGLPIDDEFIDDANRRIDELHEAADRLVPGMTGGIAATNVRAVIDWLRNVPNKKISDIVAGKGYGLEVLQRLAFAGKEIYKEQFDPAKWANVNSLDKPTDQAQRLAQAVIDRNYKSLVKYRTIRDRITGPWRNKRYYDAYAYNAQHSGRFSSFGAQFHNFPRAATSTWSGSAYNASCWDLSRALRRAVAAPEGHVLVVGDLKAIELRVLLYLAERDELISDDRDIYKEMAARIYNKEVHEISKAERHVGKSAVLGLGYGMREQAFAAYAKVDERLAIKAVGDYADMLPEVGHLRERLFDIWRGGGEIHGGLVKAADFSYGERRCKVICLPSQRNIIYWDCGAKNTYDLVSRPGAPTRMFAGQVTAHVVSGIARDILVHALFMLDRSFADAPSPRGLKRPSRMQVVGHIHDEIIAEASENKAQHAKQLLDQAMTTAPQWLAGIPLATESRIVRDWLASE